MVDVIKKGEVTEYRCDIDGKVLWYEYPNGVEKVGEGCTHLKWIAVGNGCYPEPLDQEICKGVDILRKYNVKIIQDGTTYYFLIPNYRDYY